jgi:DNA repair ATPase RecN
MSNDTAGLIEQSDICGSLRNALASLEDEDNCGYAIGIIEDVIESLTAPIESEAAEVVKALQNIKLISSYYRDEIAAIDNAIAIIEQQAREISELKKKLVVYEATAQVVTDKFKKAKERIAELKSRIPISTQIADERLRGDE